MAEQDDRDALAEVLAAHDIDLSQVRRDRDAPAGYWMACGCGFEWSPSRPDVAHHRNHLAEVLAQRDRRVAAEALRKAADYLPGEDRLPDEPTVRIAVKRWLRERARRIEAGDQ